MKCELLPLGQPGNFEDYSCLENTKSISRQSLMFVGGQLWLNELGFTPLAEARWKLQTVKFDIYCPKTICETPNFYRSVF